MSVDVPLTTTGAPPGPIQTFYEAYPIFNKVGLAPFLLALLGAVWPVVVSYRAVQARSAVQRGLRDAAAVMILPTYAKLLLLYALICSAHLIVNVLVPLEDADGFAGQPLLNVLANAAILALDRLPLEGLTIFLLHHGAGTRALKRSVVLSGCLAVVTMGIMTPAFLFYTSWGFWLALAWHAVKALVYAVLWLAPGTWVYRRPALLPYAAYWTLLRTIMVIAQVLDKLSIDAAYLFYLLGESVLFNLITPAAFFHAMVLDSQFWQGYHPAQQSWIAQLTAPLEGIRFTLKSAKSLASRLDKLAFRTQVQQLNFADVVINTHHMLGTGGQARVYLGSFKGQPVAIKVVFCIELTTSIVEDFCQEARLLSKLAHPNVVQTYGVCVVPPTVSIVMELCERGSLFTVLHAKQDSDLWIPLTWRAKLRMCRDCASAVAFLHSRNTVHRDLKSGNFLVKQDMVVKLADLGVSEENSESSSALVDLALADANESNASLPTHRQFGRPTAVSVATDTTLLQFRTLRTTATHGKAGFRGTLAWAAPEILGGAAYSPAADVYSLGLVMWEVVSRQLPFDTTNLKNISADELIAAIRGTSEWKRYLPASFASFGMQDYGFEVNGLRPIMPTNVPADLATLISGAWSSNPLQRPTAATVLDVLQRMLDACGPVTDQVHHAAFPTGVSFQASAAPHISRQQRAASVAPPKASINVTVNPVLLSDVGPLRQTPQPMGSGRHLNSI